MDGGFAEEHDVPAGEVDVFVWRVEGRRVPCQCPVRSRVEIARRKRQARNRTHAVEHRRRQQTVNRFEFLRLPRQPTTDVDRVHSAVPRFGRGEDGAVESGGEQDGGRLDSHWRTNITGAVSYTHLTLPTS